MNIEKLINTHFENNLLNILLVSHQKKCFKYEYPVQVDAKTIDKGKCCLSEEKFVIFLKSKNKKTAGVRSTEHNGINNQPWNKKKMPVQLDGHQA